MNDNAVNSQGPCSDKKNGYLYIHYHDSDAIKIIMTFNARRIAKSKRPYPVQVESFFEKHKLEHTKIRIIRGEEMLSVERLINGKLSNEQTPITLHDQYHQGKTCWPMSDEKRYRLVKKLSHSEKSRDSMQRNINIYMAFEQTQIIPYKLSDLRENDKLYILGHGKAGIPKLGSGLGTSENLHIRDIVEKLKNSGLSKAIRDIRINGCESADESTMSTFKNYTAGGLLYKLRNYVKRAKPAAMIFSEELSQAGYQDIHVSGYHGYGLTYYSLNHELHKERVLGSVYDESLIRIRERKRASLVKQVYVNGEKINSIRLNCFGRL